MLSQNSDRLNQKLAPVVLLFLMEKVYMGTFNTTIYTFLACKKYVLKYKCHDLDPLSSLHPKKGA